jgi:hypothetical protein
MLREGLNRATLPLIICTSGKVRHYNAVIRVPSYRFAVSIAPIVSVIELELAS